MTVSLSYGTAKDEVKELFFDAWTTGLSASSVVFKKINTNVAYVPEIDWHNVEERELNDNGKHWCRFNMYNNVRYQQTLGSYNTVFESLGIVVARLFLSKSSYTTEQHNLLAEICESAFTKTRTQSCVWFRNATIVDLPPTENYFRCDVTAEYIYDAIVN